LGACIVMTLVVAGGAIAYSEAYGTLAVWGDPERISWCGRTYLPGGGAGLSRSDVEQERASLPGYEPYPVVTVTRVPPLVGRPLLASVTPQAARDRLGVPCAMVVYLQTGSDSYRSYVISGGP
jgi:hypothetical protein